MLFQDTNRHHQTEKGISLITLLSSLLYLELQVILWEFSFRIAISKTIGQYLMNTLAPNYRFIFFLFTLW